VVRHQIVNDEPFGRNIDEALRMVDALQHHEEYGELCPANWRPGEPTLKESPESISEYLRKKLLDG
jgi:peroxiredoxin (alkyl hydroperoxide reductase subunit C)